MTSKKISRASRQIADQSTKGGVLGVACYFLWKAEIDPVLISLLMPIISSVLAWASTKIGDPDLACLFIGDEKKDK